MMVKAVLGIKWLNKKIILEWLLSLYEVQMANYITKLTMNITMQHNEWLINWDIHEYENKSFIKS